MQATTSTFQTPMIHPAQRVSDKPADTLSTTSAGVSFAFRRPRLAGKAGPRVSISAALLSLALSPFALGQGGWQQLEVAEAASWVHPSQPSISVEEAEDPSGQRKCVTLSVVGQATAAQGPEQHPSAGLKIPPIEVGETATVTFLIQVGDNPVHDVRCGLAGNPPNAATIRHQFRMFRTADSGSKNVSLLLPGDGQPESFFSFEPGLWYRVWLVSTINAGEGDTCKVQIQEVDGTQAPELFDAVNLSTPARSADKTLSFLSFVFDKNTPAGDSLIFLADAFWSEGENLTAPDS